MSNRPVFWLWISVSIKGERRFRFFLPIPLYLAISFADMFDDFGCLVTLFCPKVKIKTAGNGNQPLPMLTRVVTGSILSALWEVVFWTGPMDLVDVDVQNKFSSVLVKVITR